MTSSLRRSDARSSTSHSSSQPWLMSKVQLHVYMYIHVCIAQLTRPGMYSTIHVHVYTCTCAITITPVLMCNNYMSWCFLLAHVVIAAQGLNATKGICACILVKHNYKHVYYIYSSKYSTCILHGFKYSTHVVTCTCRCTMYMYVNVLCAGNSHCVQTRECTCQWQWATIGRGPRPTRETASRSGMRSSPCQSSG